MALESSFGSVGIGYSMISMGIVKHGMGLALLNLAYSECVFGSWKILMFILLLV